MIQGESKLLEKLPFRQNLDNVKRIMKLVSSLNKNFWALQALSVLLAAGVTYGGMLLSAHVVNEIAAAFRVEELLRTVVLASFALTFGGALLNLLNRRIDVRSRMISERYKAMQQEKLMAMDYSLIDSPRLKELQERIRLDGNWGNGIYSLFMQVKAVFTAVVEFSAAVFIGASVFPYFSHVNYGQAGVVMAVLAVGFAAGSWAFTHFLNQTFYTMFHVPTKEERKFSWNYTWDFALMTGSYGYQNGKDARIYDAYPVLKHWTYDKLQSREYKDAYITRPAISSAGSGAVRAAMQALNLTGTYLLVSLAALQGEMPIGSLILYAGCLYNMLNRLTDFTFQCRELALAAKKQVGILELLELSDEMYKGSLPLEKRSDNEYHIEFRNVSFKYPGSDTYALKNFSFSFRVGERLAIVGRNGSGKTTMIKLLCRLYDPQEGSILVNGVDIRKFRHDEYSKLFSVVFQDYALFSLMLAENIAVDKAYDDRKVEKCLRDAGFGERLAEFGAKGIRNFLYKDYEDDGIEISGGEAQKLAIARAIYKEAPFVLLDEPTAALDPIAESEIYTNFDKIAGDKTAIYISHRLSSCRFCDKIAVFDKGELVQTGSHEELLAASEGVYAALWNAQAKYYTSILEKERKAVG